MLIKETTETAAIAELKQRIQMLEHREEMAHKIRSSEMVQGRFSGPDAAFVRIGGGYVFNSVDDSEVYEMLLRALKGRLARQDEALRQLGIEITEPQAEVAPA